MGLLQLKFYPVFVVVSRVPEALQTRGWDCGSEQGAGGSADTGLDFIALVRQPALAEINLACSLQEIENKPTYLCVLSFNTILFLLFLIV